MTALATIPPVLNIATVDYPTIEADMSAVLEEGETIDSVTTRLQVVGGNRFIRLPDPPSVSGTSCFQRIPGNLLTVAQQCLLLWVMVLSSGDTVSQQTTIVAPY